MRRVCRIGVAMGRGRRPLTVLAVKLGDVWAVHRRPGAVSRHRVEWAVTHVPSGMVAWEGASAAEAMRVGRALAARHPRWCSDARWGRRPPAIQQGTIRAFIESHGWEVTHD